MVRSRTLDMNLEGLVLRPATEVLEWSLEEAVIFASGLREELRSRKSYAYLLLTVVFDRKPE
jgi:hypothetical protein